MSRTERLASTPDRDGMLVERPLPGAKLDAEDLRSWRTFDDVARQIDRHDVFEYWRSTPYPLEPDGPQQLPGPHQVPGCCRAA